MDNKTKLQQLIDKKKSEIKDKQATAIPVTTTVAKKVKAKVVPVKKVEKKVRKISKSKCVLVKKAISLVKSNA